MKKKKKNKKTAIVTGSGRGVVTPRRGVIVNVNSGSGKTGFENFSSYCASKFGLVGLAESAALEVNSYNIRILTIFLGQVATKMWQDLDYNHYERNKNRMHTPNEVAIKIVEMIFDDKRCKNGQEVEMYNASIKNKGNFLYSGFISL
jgi:NAD(P)-dependent dehydrogenase (short-subunit alcohol dehydrogenase family)